jgi:RNA polymerase sigma-70 factor (ECF subfamily)
MSLSRELLLPLPTRLADSPSCSGGERWLALFHEGDRATLEACYREHFTTVERAIGPLLGGADRETAIQELFSRLIGSEELRRSFRGGSLAAWLGTVARNQAIDVRRRIARDARLPAEDDGAGADGDWEEAAQARLLVERFRRDHLPPEWLGVFELRFLEQLPQREAAARLSMRRTTLAYREIRIRRLLRRFLLGEDPPEPAPGASAATRRGKP